MGQHRLFAEPFGELMGDQLRQPPGVDEDDGRAVGADEIGDAVVDLAPHLVGGDHAELVLRHLHGEVERRGGDRSRLSPARRRDGPVRKRATSSIGLTVADSPMRCGRAPPDLTTRSSSRARLNARVGTALVVDQRVDLVDDDRSRRSTASAGSARRSAG